VSEVNSGAAPAAASGSDVYAGFWRRVGAYLIDYALFLFAGIVIGVVAAMTGFWPANFELYCQLGSLVAYWLYETGMQSSAYQATLGKLALRIKVTDYEGERISFARANGRFFATLLSGLTIGIGYVMAAFTKRRQALHDIVARTLVVKTVAAPGLVAEVPVARPVPAWAIVLAILVGAVPVVGVMAAIGLPAYADYQVRSQVMDGLAAASPYKQKIVEAVAAGSTWEEIDSEVLGLPLETASPYLDSIEVAGGAIAITFGGEAASSINPAQLALVPGLNEQGEVRWTCGYASVPGGTEAVLEEHEQYTNVPEKYLPSSCRAGSSDGSSED
jgi:uncharacterized RDD family membrane protein YckC/Tfp pilus assembly major pilin PilA